MSKVLDAIASHAHTDPAKPALTCDDRSYSYATLNHAVDLLAAQLDAMLWEEDGAVGLALPNGPEWVLLDLALMRLGRPAVPLPPFFTAAQRDRALADVGAAWLIASEGVGQTIDVAGSHFKLKRLYASHSKLHPGTAKVTYTSGSTGTPKGVCLSQDHMEAVAQSIVDRFGAEFAGIHVPILPLGVLLENVAGLYPVLLAGGRYHAARPGAIGCANTFRPDFALMRDQLETVGATSLILVPELLRGLLAAIFFGGKPLSALNLVAVGGARIAPNLLNAARGLGVPVFEGYGLTECGSVVAVNAPSGDRTASVGRPLDCARVSIADDGEIIVECSVFLGYTGERPHKGPVMTGDLGRIDEYGFLEVTGRKKNLIITSFGRNISPEWIESELLAQPEILQAVVCGDGEACVSAIVSPTSPDVDRQRMAGAIDAVNARLPDYARIGHFAYVPPFTVEDGLLTGNGRPRRRNVVAHYRSHLQQGAAAE